MHPPDDLAERTLPRDSWTPLRTSARTVVVTSAAGRTTGARNGRDNEDAWGIAPDQAFVVADGIGGRPGGRVAAGAAVDALLGSLCRDVADWADVLADANHAVREAGRLHGSPHAGCVVAAVRCRGARVAIVSVGDVRAYRVRANGVQQLTRDHSVAGAMADLGIKRSDTGLGRRELDAVTSYLGDDAAWSEFSVHELTVRAGDRIVLCTDGVHRHVSIDDFVGTERDRGALAAADHLVEQALMAGTTDDATALVIDLDVTDAVTP